MDLRPYQQTAVDWVLRFAEAHPAGRALVVLPPGGGKSAVMATLARILCSRGQRGFIGAHRREIVGHLFEHALACGMLPESVGVVMGDDERERPGAALQIVSLQTLTRRAMPPADFAFTDEGHRDASDGRRKLRGSCDKALRVGFTATPCRTGGLRRDFDEMFVVTLPSALIADGYLAEPRVFTVPADLLPDLSGVPTVKGDYDTTALCSVTDKRVLVGGIIDHWKRHAEEGATVCFAVSIAHSLHLRDRFRVAGVPAEHLDCDTPATARKRILGALRDGSVRVVSCVDILSEGWDLPSCMCVIQARPTMSLALHVQQGGRGMRPWQGRRPILLDHAGNNQRLGLPHMDRSWSLDAPPPKRKGKPGGGGGGKGSRGALAKTCACGALSVVSATVCPECGDPFPVTVPEETEDELKEVRLLISEEERVAEMERLVAFGEARGFAPDWAVRVHAAKFRDATADQ